MERKPLRDLRRQSRQGQSSRRPETVTDLGKSSWRAVKSWARSRWGRSAYVWGPWRDCRVSTEIRSRPQETKSLHTFPLGHRPVAVQSASEISAAVPSPYHRITPSAIAPCPVSILRYPDYDQKLLREEVNRKTGARLSFCNSASNYGVQPTPWPVLRPRSTG